MSRNLRRTKFPRHRHQPKRLRPQFESLEPRLVLATINWDGGAGDDEWTTAANWVGDELPEQDDDVVISAAFSGRTITHGAGNTVVNSIVSAASLNISNGNLAVAGRPYSMVL